MRFGAYLFALVAFAAGAQAKGELRVRADLPAGGLPVIAAGFSLHTPGAGWQMLNDLSPVDGIVSGGPRITFIYKPKDNAGADKDHDVTFGLGTDWRADPVADFAALEARTREDLALEAKLHPGATFEFHSESRNGAQCAGWRMQGGEEVWLSAKLRPQWPMTFVKRRCMHPEFPRFTIDMEYAIRSAKGDLPPAVEAEAAAAMDSVRFTPLPLRAQAIVLPSTGSDVAEGFGSVWVDYRSYGGRDRMDRHVVRIDPAAHAIVADIRVAREPSGSWNAGYSTNRLVAGPDGIWVAIGRRMFRIDPATNAVANEVVLPLTIQKLIAGGRYLWASTSRQVGNTSDEVDQTVFRIDPHDGVFEPVHQPGGVPRDILFADGALYIAVGGDQWCDGDVLHRIDPARLVLSGHQFVGCGPRMADGHFLWAMWGVKTPEATKDTLLPFEDRTHLPFGFGLAHFDLQAPDAPPDFTGPFTAKAIFFPNAFFWWNGKLCIDNQSHLACYDPAAPDKPSQDMPLPSVLRFSGKIFPAAGSLWTPDDFTSLLLRLDPK